MLTIDVVTLFPEVIAPYVATSIPGRAAAAGLVKFRLVQLRDFTHDRHSTVDDYAYGGGAGMVLKPEPFFEAIDTLRPTGPIVLLSARGRRFTHDDAVRFSLGERLTLLCGHYKDVDQRVADGLATEELEPGVVYRHAITRTVTGADGRVRTNEAATLRRQDSYWSEPASALVSWVVIPNASTTICSASCWRKRSILG